MKLRYLTAFCIMAIFFASCGSGEKEGTSKHMAPLEIDVPSELKNNKEAVQFIESSELVINEWSNTLEDLLQDTEEYAGVSEEELSMVDKMKLIKLSTEFAAKMAEFGLKMAELETTASALENGLSGEELAAFETIYQAFENRINELGEKYENYGK